ncbi:YciI family protein [Streptomyces sp. NPDC047130]|uniref:YciI family protein n=1 Tax=Streptomyces sp. NPDC047130 TaxID=3155261 RepID=UPI0033CC9D7B
MRIDSPTTASSCVHARRTAMYILMNTYTVPTQAIDAELPRHRRWVEHHFAEGHFIFGGRREPRTGGFVVAATDDEGEAREYLEEEPLFAQGLVTWELFGLVPQLSSGPTLRAVLDSFGATTSLPGTAGDGADEAGPLRVRVNGEVRVFPPVPTVESVVEELCEARHVGSETVSASLDGTVLPREGWGVPLRQGADLRVAVLTSGG